MSWLTDSSPPAGANVRTATVVYDTARARGQRLVSVALDGGRELRPDGTYTLVMNDFMVTNEDYGPSAKVAVEPLRLTDLEALIQWAGSRPQPLQPDATPRIRLTTEVGGAQ